MTVSTNVPAQIYDPDWLGRWLRHRVDSWAGTRATTRLHLGRYRLADLDAQPFWTPRSFQRKNND